jgi:hypothetical protein
MTKLEDEYGAMPGIRCAWPIEEEDEENVWMINKRKICEIF